MAKELYYQKSAGDHNYLIYDDSGNTIASTEFNEPIAAMMAAAPELLEACIEMADAVEAHERRTGITQMVGCVSRLRAAIAKARGVQP